MFCLLAEQAAWGVPKDLQLPKYAVTPILEHIITGVKLLGTVYVAYVCSSWRRQDLQNSQRRPGIWVDGESRRGMLTERIYKHAISASG